FIEPSIPVIRLHCEAVNNIQISNYFITENLQNLDPSYRSFIVLQQCELKMQSGKVKQPYLMDKSDQDNQGESNLTPCLCDVALRYVP
ncbi:hypothetical protein EJB05_02904, partial [Eragrostis curvula]